jgi:hypothetical protein
MRTAGVSASLVSANARRNGALLYMITALHTAESELVPQSRGGMRLELRFRGPDGSNLWPTPA